MSRGRSTAPRAAGWEGRAIAGQPWPGITAGMDSRCSCTRAPLNGVYQVKVRDVACLNHGGELGAVLARMARWRQGVKTKPPPCEGAVRKTSRQRLDDTT